MRRLTRTLALIGIAGLTMATSIGDYSANELAEIAADHGLEPTVFGSTGDIEYGEYLAGECTTCHQASGDASGIPGIVGWDPVWFMVAMHEYKTEQREHPAMRMVAGRLGDEEIASLALYFQSLEEE